MISPDRVIAQFDAALRALFAPAASRRPIPGDELPAAALSDAERRQAIGLMRVNHCGEICAQALYQGQAIASGDPDVQDALRAAGREETEHLAWTERRLAELQGRKSLLNPLWYTGALVMGMAAGKLGDRWNLGFLAETERQVEAHLASHLERLPAEDLKSRAIVRQMKSDEARHAHMAVRLGAAELPAPVKLAMRAAARVMTRTAFYV